MHWLVSRIQAGATCTGWCQVHKLLSRAQAGATCTGWCHVNRLVSALRALGFSYVFDTNFSADLTILEEASHVTRTKSST